MPDYSDFKVFDCLFCVSVRESDKFSPRAIRCVFLGYPHVHKGFKLLDLTNHKQFISMNVIFYEIVFSFLDKSDTAPPPDFYHLQNCLHFDTSNATSGTSFSSPPNISLNHDSSHLVDCDSLDYFGEFPDAHDCSDTNSPNDLPLSNNSPVDETINSSDVRFTSFLDNLPPSSDRLTNMSIDDVSVPMPGQFTRSRVKPTLWTDYVIPG